MRFLECGGPTEGVLLCTDVYLIHLEFVVVDRVQIFEPASIQLYCRANPCSLTR
jgi:hypothetical protein